MCTARPEELQVSSHVADNSVPRVEKSGRPHVEDAVCNDFILVGGQVDLREVALETLEQVYGALLDSVR